MTRQVTQALLDLGPEPVRPKRPAEPIARTAVKQKVGTWTYRFVMHRAWGAKGKTIFWGLLNPSDADGRRDDPTTWRMIEFSWRWGFDRMIVGNIYPVVSSTPDLVADWRLTWDHKKWEAHGMRALPEDASTYSAFANNCGLLSAAVDPEMTFVAAWGAKANSDDVDYFLNNVQPWIEDEEFGRIQIEPDWYCLGKTTSGAPIHPLARGKHRVPNDATLKIWKRAQRPREDVYS